MPPPGRPHGIVCLTIGAILLNYCEKRRRGYVCSNDTALIVSRGPDTVRGPDVSLYAEGEEKTFRQVVGNAGDDRPLPLLAVEILSPRDRPGAVMRKVKQYQDGGVELVWVVDPVAEDVMVHRIGVEPQFLDSGDTLDGGDLLPGFSHSVADFFRLPWED